MLESIIEQLKDFDPNLPAGIKFDAPHDCCNNGAYCYASDQEVDLYSLHLSMDKRYDRKNKTQKLEKVYLTGN